MATKKIETGVIVKTVDNLKTTVNKLQNEAVNISDNLVDASIKTGGKWQKLMAKALTEGTVLFGKQQDFVLDTLEELKGQYMTGQKRFKKLVGLELPQKKKVTKSVKTIKVEVEEGKKTVAKIDKEFASSKSDVAVDDLKIINGIGPKMESLLNEAGISTFKRLAATDLKELKTILEAAGPRFKSLNPTSWKEQAQLAADGKLVKKAK